MTLNRFASISLVMCVVGMAPSVQAVSVRVEAADGIAGPDGTVFSSAGALIGGPSINESGEFAFEATFTDGETGFQGVFAKSIGGPARKVLVQGDPDPFDPNLLTGAATLASIDEAGRVTALAVFVDQIDDPDTAVGLINIVTESSPGASLLNVIRASSPASSVPSPFSAVDPFLAVSGAGDVFAGGQVPNGSETDLVFGRFDRATETFIEEVVERDDVLGDGRELVGFFAGQVNDANQIQGLLVLEDPATGENTGVGLARFTPGVGFEYVADSTTTAPTGETVTTVDLNRSQMNDLGDLAISLTYDEAGGSEVEIASLIEDGQPAIELFRVGQNLPGTSDSIDELGEFAINDAKQVAVEVEVDFDSAIVLTDSTGELTTIAVEGQTPFSGGTLGEVEIVDLTESGQVYFQSWDRFNDFQGLFVHDPVLGLIEIVLAGQELAGGVLENITIDDILNTTFEETQFSVNNAGQGIFYFRLEDDRTGVASFVIPEPGVFLLAVSCGLVVSMRRSVRR